LKRKTFLPSGKFALPMRKIQKHKMRFQDIKYCGKRYKANREVWKMVAGGKRIAFS
jgi:hypothetical protein